MEAICRNNGAAASLRAAAKEESQKTNVVNKIIL